MKINESLKEIFEDFCIDWDEGILYLLSVFFNLKIKEEKFEEVIKKVNFAKIIDKDYKTGVILWNIDLFKDVGYISTPQENNWKWVIDWRESFKRIRPDRAGTLNACIIRMKNFFANNPHIRKQDVMEATEMYLQTVKDPNYLISAHYFIKKDKGINEQSKLEEFLELLQENRKNNARGEML